MKESYIGEYCRHVCNYQLSTSNLQKIDFCRVINKDTNHVKKKLQTGCPQIYMIPMDYRDTLYESWKNPPFFFCLGPLLATHARSVPTFLMKD